MTRMATIPDSTKTSLRQRLTARARERWPQLDQVKVRYRAGFAYVDGVLADGDDAADCADSATPAPPARWGFAIYRASHDDYEDSVPARPASPAAPPKTPSTPPAASTSATPPPGPEPPTNLRRATTSSLWSVGFEVPESGGDVEAVMPG